MRLPRLAVRWAQVTWERLFSTWTAKDDDAMMYVKQLVAEEYQALKEMSRKEVGRVSQRAHIVLMSAKNVAVPTIAALFEVSPATVRFWIRKFEAEGPKGLYDESRSGRPRNGNGSAQIRSYSKLGESLRNLNHGQQGQL
jgi:hypothetical protein